MPIEITMPKLSDTMEEGTILRWYKRVGERVEPGDVLAEVETDKADMELESDKTGIIAEIRVPEGKPAPVGAVIVLLTEATEAAPAPRAEPAAKIGPAASVAETAPAPRAAPIAEAPPPRPAKDRTASG